MLSVGRRGLAAAGPEPDASRSATSGRTCGRGNAITGLELKAGSVYHLVLDGDHGMPYGSFRGGHGIRVKRRDGEPFFGWCAPALIN